MAAIKDQPDLRDLFEMSPLELRIHMSRGKLPAAVPTPVETFYVVLTDEIKCECCGKVTRAPRGLFMEYKERGALTLRAVSMIANKLPAAVKKRTHEATVQFCEDCPIADSIEGEKGEMLELSKSKGGL